MKNKYCILGLLIIALPAFCQENKSFEQYKKEQKEAFEKYVIEEEKKFEAFKKQELDWNKATLGYEAEPVIIKVKEDSMKSIVPTLPVPDYVDLKSNINNELKSIKANIKSRVKPKALPKEKADETVNNIYQKELNQVPSISPIQDKYRLSSKFGPRFHPIKKYYSRHNGIDLACPTGTNVHSPANGKVIYVGFDKGYGNFLKIDHGNGFVTVYAHLSKIHVKKGAVVNKKDIIAKVGSTGMSTGAHLHYEVIKNNKKVNPARFIV